MTYDPRDTDPLYTEEEYGWIYSALTRNRPDIGASQDRKAWPAAKLGVPRAVLVWGFAAAIALLAILAAALLLRGGAA